MKDERNVSMHTCDLTKIYLSLLVAFYEVLLHSLDVGPET